MADYIDVGAGDIATSFPDGSVGFTDSNGTYDSNGELTKPDGRATPAVTADFEGAPPTNSIFTPLAYHQYGGFTQWMNANPQSFQTAANGLEIANVSTANLGGDGGSYSYGPSAQDMTLGLAGLNVTEADMAAQSDWSATADWGGKMRATLVQGGLFTYVNRLSSDDVTINFNQIVSSSATTPSNALTYTASGLTGSYNGKALTFNLPIDAGSEVADQVRVLVSYDFNGDGKTDRTELYYTFSTDASDGWESCDSGKATLLSSTGTMKDLANGSVKVQLWRVNGRGDNISLETDSDNSQVTLPYTGLISNGAAVDSSTLYVQGGATAGDQASTLATTPGSTPSSDTLHVVPKVSIGGYSGPGQIWYNQDGVVGVTINGQSYGIFANADVTWNYTAQGLTSSLDGSNYYSVAVLPDASVSTLMDFRQHAFAEVTGTEAKYTVDKATNSLTTTFTYTTQMMSSEQGLSSDPLTALYYNQYTNSDAQTQDYGYASPRGEMKGFAGSSFSTTLPLAPILPLMPFLGTDAQKAELQEMLHEQLRTFLQANDPLGGDTYWGTRQIAKYTDLAMLAQQVGYGQARDTFLQAAEKQLETWFTASDGDNYEFVYDKIWHAMIGYPASYDADDKSNDLTLQLGYMVNAAATIATLDPAWAKQSNFGAMVDMVIKNANNPDRDDPTFGYLRGFDVYAGHNWASGTGFGITQESATESLNFDAAVARWGAATGEAEMEDLGQYLYSTESQAFADYYLDVNSTAFPDGFDHGRIGILSADGGSYGTYFGAQPWYVQGINETPILSQSSLFMGYYSQEIEQDFAELDAQIAAADAAGDGPAVNDLWSNSFAKYMALADPQAALAYYQKQLAAGYTDGGGEESKADTTAFLESLAVMGTIDATTHSDSPYSAVYVKDGAKTYVAWNPSVVDAMTVTFTDGTKVAVGVNSMATRTPDGQVHVTDFAGSIDYRPAGIALDLPTDPPAYALTTVSVKGDLTLSEEATTGSAWLTVGGGQPRVLLHADGSRLAIQAAANSRLVAVGRDASGTIHVLMAGGANGTEPFYDKILGANYGIKENGPALYGATDYATLEPLYGQDFNKDGIVEGGALTQIAANGTLTLWADSGTGLAYFRNGTGKLIPIFRNADGKATLLTRGAASLSTIGMDADGNVRVLDEVEGVNTVWAWKLDANGNWVGEAAYDTTQASISSAEAIFQVDLNGDGQKPAPLPQIVARNGALQLLVDANGYAEIRLEDGSILAVMRGGQPVKLDRGSQLSAVGRDENGNLRVLDGSPNDFSASSQHWAWELDAKGNWTREDAYSGSTITQVEGLFDQDFNGDGIITGAAQKIVIEAFGGDTLYKDQTTGQAFVSVNGAAPIAISRDGTTTVQLTRGDYSLVAVAQDSDGRTRVLDADPFSDLKYAWILDSTGHWAGEASFNTSTVGTAETMFGIDLNGDGVIGKASITMAASASAMLRTA